MNSLFQPSLQVLLGASVDSFPVNIGVADGLPVQIAITSGTALLVKNGVASGQSTTVLVTDQLVIRAVASTSYATATHITLTVDNTPYSYTVVSKDDDRLHAYPPQIGVLPVFLRKNHDGTDYFDNGAGNKLAMFSAGALVSRIPAEYSGQITAGIGANGSIFSPVYLDNFVLRLDSQTYEVIGSTWVGNKPFQSCEFGDPGLPLQQLHLVTVSAADEVAVLDSSGTVLDRLAVSGLPMGIASSGACAFVACYSGQSVAILTKTVSGWDKIVAPTSGYAPFNIVWDGQYAWATCPMEDSLLRIDMSGNVSVFPFPGMPTGIAWDGTKLWVTLGTEKSVVTWTALEGILSTTVVEEMPYSIVCDLGGTTYVGCFGRSAVFSISGASVAEISSGSALGPAYQMRSVGASGLAVFEYYPTTPKYLYVLDSSVGNLRLTDAYRVRTLQNISTNVTTVTGLSDGLSLPISIPALYGATIVKNLVAAGAGTTVSNGDQVYLNFTVPSRTDCNIQIPMFIGNNYDYFLSVVPVPDPVIFPVIFAHLESAQLNTTYTSNTVTITGIDQGSTITLSLSGGVLIKNGTMLPGIYTTSLQNGDTVAIKVTSSTNMGVANTCLLDFGAYKTYWTVITQDISRNWLNSACVGLELYDIPVPPQTSNVYRSKNSVQKIKKSDYTVGPELSLYNAAVVPNSSLVEFNYAVSYYENLIYKVSPNGSVAAISTLDTNALPRSDGLYAPSWHQKSLLAKTRYVSVSTLHIREVDTPDADVPLYVGTGWIGATAKSPDGQTVYVAAQDGTIGVYVYDSTIALFKRITSIDCRSVGPSFGGLRELAVDSTGALWALDVANNVLIRIVSGTIVTVTGLGSASIWAMTLGASAVWLADTNHNTVIKIGTTLSDIQAIVRVGSVPSAVAIDSTTGNIWVAYYASPKIDIINPNTNQITRTITLASPVSGLLQDNSGYMWVLHMYPDMYVTSGSTVNDSAIPLPIFTTVVGAAPTVRVKSNTVPISGLPRPIRLTVADVNNTRLYVNSDVAGTVSASINNGDTLSLGTDAPLDFASTNNVIFTGFNTPVRWSVTTSPDLTPDYVYFDPVYDLRLRYASASSPVTITGISPGSSITLSVLNHPGMSISVDGTVYVGAAPAVLGSSVSILYDTTGWYYGQAVTFELQHGVPGAATTFGLFDASTLVLLGVSRNPIYDLKTYDYIGYEYTLHRSLAISQQTSGVKLPTSVLTAPAAVGLQVERKKLISVQAIEAMLLSPAELLLGPVRVFEKSLSAHRDAPLPDIYPFVREVGYYMAQPAQAFTVVRDIRTAAVADSELVPTKRVASTVGLIDSAYLTGAVQAHYRARFSEYTPPTVRSNLVAGISVYDSGIHHIGSEVADVYDSGTHHIGLEIDARYQLGMHHIGSEVADVYDSGTHHIGLEIDARYQLGMHHIGSEISAYYKPSTHHIGLEIAARYQLGIHHIGHEVSQLGERNAIRPRLTIGTDYARDAATTPVAVTTYWRPARTRNTLLASVTPVRSPVRAVKTADTSVYVVTTSAARLVQYRPFARVAGKRTVEIDQLQPFRYFPVNEMLAGQITDQQVYSSQSSAVAAAAALGYALSNITTWWFHTFIEVNGANDVAVAWMWKVPPEITSRDCGSASGLGSKYPIPHKWLVQGG